jgi:hypothetical protein
MSTLAVNSIVDANSGNTTQINGMTPTADSLQGFRNRIINGDMRIAQRGTTATPTSSGYYTIDRFRLSGNSILIDPIAPVTSQSTDAPSGFTNSFLWTNTNAVTPTTVNNVRVEQSIEGNNIADLAWGTANAQPVTLSFWVRSSLTGTFGGALNNSALDRSYPFTYAISSPNTWEYKTIIIAGDTTGTWLTTNGIGMDIIWALGQGSDRLGTAGSWTSNNHVGVTGQVQLAGTLNATWQITGVQLEAGSVATPFERRPYGTELALCQRYFEKSYGDSVVPGTNTSAGATYTAGSTQFSGIKFGSIVFAVNKRAAPTVTMFALNGTSGQWFYERNGASGNSTCIVDGVSERQATARHSGIGANWSVATGGGHWVAVSEL